MGTPSLTIHDSAKEPTAELWFAEPPSFTALPLQAMLPMPGSQAADTLHTAVAPFLDAAPDDMVRQQFIAQFAKGQQLLSVLREVGTVHCSIGLHRDDIDETDNHSGQPLISLFTVSWRDTAVVPRAITAARAVTSGEDHTHVEYLELPCGPATVSETLRTPSMDSGLPQTPFLQVHAHLPHPDCKRLVVLTLSTTTVARREQYRTILRQIAETVSFDNPLEPAMSEAR